MSGDEEAREITEQLAGSSLNASARSFVPQASAPEFVPSWLRTETPAEPAPSPAFLLTETTEEPQKSEPPPAVPVVTEKTSNPPASEEPTPVEEGEEEEEADESAKQHVNIVFIGHVDAGKSTIGGNILFLTGMVDKRTMEKYEKEAREQGRESWYLSWALDTSAEERAKGKTVECGRAYFETDKRRVTILDAPGHKNYVPSMISGASQADVAILVISARKGEFETGFERGGQTREHAILAKTSGVNRLVVAINKMDDSTVGWSEARYNECVSKLTPFLKNTGYNPKTDILFMPISGFCGTNLKDRVTKDVCPWYDGPSLLEYLDNIEVAGRKNQGPLMVPITEKSRELGTTVAGKIESGRIKKGKRVIIMPCKKTGEVVGIVSEENEIESAITGDNVRLRLRGIEEEDIGVGFVLSSIDRPAKTVRAFEAQLVIIDHENIICAGYSAVMHIHTCVEEIVLGKLLHKLDKKTGRRSKAAPVFLQKGEKAIVRIETNSLICVELFDDFPQLGRFTLRDKVRTVAIGKVTKLIESE